MIKPASLRKAIAAALPDLAANPDKFLVFADEGAVVATGSASLSFEYRYTLNLILMDFAGDADQLMVALLAWVAVNQSDLVDNYDKQKQGITFEVDHLNHDTCDLSVKLALTESVKVTTDAAGQYVITHKTEPVPEWKRGGLA